MRALDRYGPYLLLVVLFCAALIWRPLLPIDETRYMTVAWEMFLQKRYAVMSLNFTPYHHKPPMLFWLIDAAWQALGVSRWAALIPVFLASLSLMVLIRKLAHRVWENKVRDNNSKFLPWLVIGAVPFLLYSTLLMFDILVSVWLLLCMILFLDHVRNPRWWRPVLAGLMVGCGILTKGPVMYLYVLWPLLLYPFWRKANDISIASYYRSLGVAAVISLLPVALWLYPALKQTTGDFAFWLLWEQTAGRISGNMGAAHSRPFYFYFMVLPVLFMPWIFFPSVWKNLKTVNGQRQDYRFLAAATLPVFLSFCLIAGKQPHYLMPLFPYIIIALGAWTKDVRPSVARGVAVILVASTIIGQAVAAQTSFVKYDLKPFAAFYKEHADVDWAFVRNYQGEIGYLARVEKKIDDLEFTELSDWLVNHPQGYALVRYSDRDNISDYNLVYTRPYKGKQLGVFTKK